MHKARNYMFIKVIMFLINVNLPAICKEGVNPCRGFTLAAFDKVNLHIVRPQNARSVNTIPQALR